MTSPNILLFFGQTNVLIRIHVFSNPDKIHILVKEIMHNFFFKRKNTALKTHVTLITSVKTRKKELISRLQGVFRYIFCLVLWTVAGESFLCQKSRCSAYILDKNTF